MCGRHEGTTSRIASGRFQTPRTWALGDLNTDHLNRGQAKLATRIGSPPVNHVRPWLYLMVHDHGTSEDQTPLGRLGRQVRQSQ